MKKFFKKYGGAILRTVIILLIIAAFSVGVYFILRACGFTTKEDFLALRDKIGDNIWFWITIGALQIFQCVFVPLTNQVITVPCAFIFSDNTADLFKLWITSWISIWLATMILYWIGRSGGKLLLKWILKDEEETEKCANWIRRGWIFYPLGMLLPLPDDVVTTLAGTAKMNFLFVIVCSFFTRAIDTACSVFGFGFLTRWWWGWLLLGIGVVLLLLLTYFFWKIDRKITDKKKAQQTIIEEEK